jgi:hypothetical protein
MLTSRPLLRQDLTQRLLDAELELQDSRSELSAWITKCCNMQDDMNKMKLQVSSRQI